MRDPRDHDGEDPDPARGGGLYERKWCERERDNVKGESAHLDARTDEPPRLDEQ
jgi:hypothetical protein